MPFPAWIKSFPPIVIFVAAVIFLGAGQFFAGALGLMAAALIEIGIAWWWKSGT